MADLLPLSDKTAREIEALARQISVAQHLDDEIQAELRGHIQDKLRGYLSGEVRVSEGDALLLAKAHFGDARVVKGMFQGLHRTEYATSLARRLVAAFVATQVVSAVIAVVVFLYKALIDYHISEIEGAVFPQAHQLALMAGILVLEAALLWAIFFYWRWCQAAGRRMWFEKWNPIQLAFVVLVVMVGLLSLDWAIRQSVWYISFGGTNRTYEMVVIGWVLECISRGTQAALWIWWCDGAPRSRRTLLYAMISWIAAARLAACFVTIALWSLGGEISLHIITGFIPSMLSAMSLNLEVEALVGVLALIFYSSFKRRENAAIAM